MQNRIFYFLSPVAVLVAWEILTVAKLLDARFFPAPSAILYELFYVTPKEQLYSDISASLSRIFFGYLFGSTIGVMGGLALALLPRLRQIAYPLVAMAYPIPKIAIFPLIMLVFGLGEMSKIIVVAIGSFFLVLLSTLSGVDAVAKIYHDIAYVYRIPLARRLFHIIIPCALPSIFTGLRLAIGYSLVIVVAAEFSGAEAGIGYRIWASWETFSIKALYGGIFIIGLLGILFSITIDKLEKWLIPWKRQSLPHN